MIYSKEYVKEKFPYATCIELHNNPSSTFKIETENDFLAFMNIVKPSIVFTSELFVNIDFFKIDTTFERRNGLNPAFFEDKDFVKFILPMCEEHNKNIQNNIVTNIPANISVFVLHDGCCIQYTYQNDINPHNITLSVTDALLEIIHNNEEKWNEIKAAKRKKEFEELDMQRDKLKNKILADEKFTKCTSQPKRKSYIRQLLQLELGNEYNILKKHWIMENRGFRSDVDWFIEEVWDEKKSNCNND